MWCMAGMWWMRRMQGCNALWDGIDWCVHIECDGISTFDALRIHVGCRLLTMTRTIYEPAHYSMFFSAAAFWLLCGLNSHQKDYKCYLDSFEFERITEGDEKEIQFGEYISILFFIFFVKRIRYWIKFIILIEEVSLKVL